MQAGDSAQAQGIQQPPQPLSDPSQLLHTTMPDLSRQHTTDAMRVSSEDPDAKLTEPSEAATEAGSPAEGDFASHRESESETEVNELTHS